MNLEQATDYRLQEIADLVHSGVTEMTGKSRRAGGFGEGEFVGRYGGLKPMYPELQALKESPSKIAEAIDRGSGVLYERVRGVVEDAVIRGEEIREFKRPKRSAGKLSIAPHAGRVYCRHCAVYHTKGQHRFHGEGSYLQTHLFPFKNPMTHAQAKKTFAEIMEGLRRGLHLSPEGKRVFEQAKAICRQYRKPVMRNRRRAQRNPKGKEVHFKIGQKVILGKLNKTGVITSIVPKEHRSNPSQGAVYAVQTDSGIFYVTWREMVPAIALRNPRGKLIYGEMLDATLRKTQPHRCDAACRRVNHTYRHHFRVRPSVFGNANGSFTVEDMRL